MEKAVTPAYVFILTQTCSGPLFDFRLDGSVSVPAYIMRCTDRPLPNARRPVTRQLLSLALHLSLCEAALSSVWEVKRKQFWHVESIHLYTHAYCSKCHVLCSLFMSSWGKWGKYKYQSTLEPFFFFFDKPPFYTKDCSDKEKRRSYISFKT